MNDRGKNKHTNVFQIAVGQGWQAVFERCCSGRHFKSICTNDSNPAAQQNKHDMQTVVNRYKAEVVPFSSRCAQVRKQPGAKRQRAVAAHSVHAAQRSTSVAHSNSIGDQTNRIQSKFVAFVAKMGVSSEITSRMANQGSKLQDGKSR